MTEDLWERLAVAARAAEAEVEFWQKFDESMLWGESVYLMVKRTEARRRDLEWLRSRLP